MFLLHILLALILTSTSAYKLGRLENEHLQITCGRSQYHRKVINGVDADLSHYKFAVSVNINGTLSATAISPRHIILFNIVEKDSNGALSLFDDMKIQGSGYCEGNDFILPKEANQLFKVNFVKQQDYKIAVSKIIVVNGCEKLNTFLPMIIEVEENLQFNADTLPVCLSDSADNFDDSEEFEVFGLGPRGKRLTASSFYPTKCFKKDVQEYTSCAKPVNQSQGLCAGDFGGGAIAIIDRREVLVGIYAEGNVNCDKDPETHQVPEFTNVGYFAKAICASTGVCVKGAVEPMTTEDPMEYTDVPEEPTTPEEVFTDSPIEYTDSPIDYTDSPIDYTDSPIEVVETGPPEEPIIAETFEKMKLGSCAGEDQYKDHVKNIHIHIHLDEHRNNHIYEHGHQEVSDKRQKDKEELEEYNMFGFN